MRDSPNAAMSLADASTDECEANARRRILTAAVLHLSSVGLQTPGVFVVRRSTDATYSTPL